MKSTGVEEDFRRRLRLIMQQFGSVADLANAVGVSDNAIYKWVSGRGQPGMASLVNLAKAAGVSVEWLATGQGLAARASVDDFVPPDFAAYRLMPRGALPPTAALGPLRSPQIVPWLAFHADWLKRRFDLDPGRLALIETQGDAMSPTIDDGDLVLIDLGQTVFQHDGLYTLSQPGGLAVKRLQRDLDGAVLVRSDNPAYPPIRSAAPDLPILGRAIWLAGPP